jgi:hypothetical protein
MPLRFDHLHQVLARRKISFYGLALSRPVRHIHVLSEYIKNTIIINYAKKLG